MYSVAGSQPMRLGGRHCSDACSVTAAVLAVSRQLCLGADSQSVELVSCGLSSIQSTCSEVVIFVTAAAVGPLSC